MVIPDLQGLTTTELLKQGYVSFLVVLFKALV
jgi:hypothetical protein